ncbi:MAG TPA: hypothetical protein VJV05_00315 [Pyrinomonadaceae bacterium]|nr:hypothetical protein [Pyrinomonadaceae bacterium]
MFDQELYEQRAAELQMEPGDPFYKYEIKNWDFTPRLYKILTFSAVANILALVVISSSGLLTARGCDSPFVGRVCQVLDTVYVGSLIFGTESEYGDMDYEQTKLSDADIVWIDQTGVTPPLTYPAGYFQLANPEQNFSTDPTTLEPGFLAPGIPSNPTLGGSGLLNTQPIAPPSNPNPIDGDLPTGSPFGTPNESPNTFKGRKGRNQRPFGGTTANTNTNTNPTTDANANLNNPTVADDACKEDQNQICLNKRPLADKTTDTLAQVNAGKVSLDKPFRVMITGTLALAKDGKTVVLKDPKAEPIDKNFPADAALTKLAQEWVVAVGDAGWYGYLGIMDAKKGVGKKLTVFIEQNDATFIANVKSEQANPEKANSAATGLRNLMTLGALTAKEDEITFLKSANLSSEGNLLLVNFEMPKAQVQEMIQRKLAEIKDKASKPEGSATMKPVDNRAER